jgi:hypothetical protein
MKRGLLIALAAVGGVAVGVVLSVAVFMLSEASFGEPATALRLRDPQRVEAPADDSGKGESPADRATPSDDHGANSGTDSVGDDTEGSHGSGSDDSSGASDDSGSGSDDGGGSEHSGSNTSGSNESGSDDSGSGRSGSGDSGSGSDDSGSGGSGSSDSTSGGSDSSGSGSGGSGSDDSGSGGGPG